jgi:hypothetical protein
MPRVKRRTGFIHRPPPGFRSFMDDLWAYSRREKRVLGAHMVVMLCKFGRWVTWALCPKYRFFPAWTDQVDGKMSWEMRAELSLKPNPNLPLMMGMAIVPALLGKRFQVKGGA